MSAAMQHRRIITVTTATPETNPAFTAMVGEIVSAYISNNHIAPTDLPALIATVHAAISGLGTGAAVEPAKPPAEKLTPAQIRKSVTKDAIISFIDGRRYKTLKRHLTVHGLAPDTYRAQFGLPPDYPMVAAAYSEIRSSLAKSLGLGVQNRGHAKAVKAATSPKVRKTAA